MATPNRVAPPPQKQGRVLVVDDSRLVRMVVARYLKAAGYDVEDADSGARALEKVATGAYDVVITDLRMPGLDGFEVLATVKRLAPAVEVIILTGTHAKDVGCAIRALRLGAHDYLTKPPANADEVTLTVGRAVEKKRLRDANQRLLHQLETLSRTDELTGLLNRRAFDETLQREVARSRRHNHPVGVVLLDIDHFKKVNDTHGHPVGDQVLRTLSAVVAAAVRSEDTLYRYGGEEFVALLPHVDLAKEMLVAERIVAKVAHTPLRIGASDLQITVSAGAAVLRTQDDGEALVARADEALYRAKAAGRNQACASAAALTLVAGGRAG
jgi:two-component system, cell cycle response regulator